MSKFTGRAQREDAVVNHMNGVSYRPTPITRARLVLSSSIFGEQKYYTDSLTPLETVIRNTRKLNKYDQIIGDRIRADEKVTSAQFAERIIDEALDYDFKATLELAVSLRHEYGMRLNPAVMIVRAAVHPRREAFTKQYPGAFASAVKWIARRPDDLTTMVEYYLACFGDRKNGSKVSRLPGVLKRAIAARLSDYDQYQMAKYQNYGIGLRDVVNIVHPRPNDIINELMRDGRIPVREDKKQWRHALSEGKTWKDVLAGDYVVTHQDLLYQMRNILSTQHGPTIERALELFVSTAEKAKVWPYKYWIAWTAINKEIRKPYPFSDAVDKAFDRALSMSVLNMPMWSGRTMCLSDNSGSAKSARTFGNAEARVCDIGNLSSILTALTSDEGYVGVFGDKLETARIQHDSNIMYEMERVSELGATVGNATENGVWLFFKDAIQNGVWWDNIWIYSDQQAGHGGLYVHEREAQSLREMGAVHAAGYHTYVDVLELVRRYRAEINPRVNVFTVQTAGYDNSLLPENFERGAMLSGWTGMESLYARIAIDAWESAEQQ